MWAAAEGHPDVVQLLIDHKAEVNAASKSGFTALVFAAVKDDPKSVQELLAAGADPNFALPDGTKVLLVAASHKSSHAGGGAGGWRRGPQHRRSWRQYAAAHGGAGRRGRPGQEAAVQGRGCQCAHRQGGRRADAGAAGFRQISGEQTPLMVAAKANHPEAMRALVAGGADPALKAQDGSTLLMMAVGSGHVEAVQYAYELDSDVKAVNATKATLMHAAVSGTMQNSTQPEICKVIQFLADKGAPLDEKDGRGRTPIDLADILPIDKAVDLITKLIIQSGGTPKTPSKR